MEVAMLLANVKTDVTCMARDSNPTAFYTCQKMRNTDDTTLAIHLILPVHFI